jgi:hypothetical protein
MVGEGWRGWAWHGIGAPSEQHLTRNSRAQEILKGTPILPDGPIVHTTQARLRAKAQCGLMSTGEAVTDGGLALKVKRQLANWKTGCPGSWD